MLKNIRHTCKNLQASFKIHSARRNNGDNPIKIFAWIINKKTNNKPLDKNELSTVYPNDHDSSLSVAQIKWIACTTVLPIQLKDSASITWVQYTFIIFSILAAVVQQWSLPNGKEIQRMMTVKQINANWMP